MSRWARAALRTYSVAQQLIVSAWDVALAVALVAWVFGWSGGKELVRRSYSEAGVKRRELQQQRSERRAARKLRVRRRAAH